MPKKSYADKYRDPRWQKKRLEIMERDGFQCQICGGADNSLNVHHLYYEKNLNIWDYNADTLITVCEECHKTYARDFAFESAKVMYRNIKGHTGNPAEIMEIISTPAQTGYSSRHKSISFDGNFLEERDAKNIEDMAYAFHLLPPPWLSRVLFTLREITDWALQSYFYEVGESEKNEEGGVPCTK